MVIMRHRALRDAGIIKMQESGCTDSALVLRGAASAILRTRVADLIQSKGGAGAA